MKTIQALSIGLLGIQAGQADVKTLQELQIDHRMDIDGYEPEHPEMELIVSDFGAKAPNLGKHHHKHKKNSRISKTVPITAKPVEAAVLIKPKQVAAQAEDEDEVGDPNEYEKAEAVDADELDAYTNSIIADKQGKSISQMMAQDEENRKAAEFSRQQAEAKKATDLANSLKKVVKAPPKKTDEEDVLDLVQKMEREEAEEDKADASSEQDDDSAKPIGEKMKAQQTKKSLAQDEAPTTPVSQSLKNEEIQPSLYGKNIAEEAAAVSKAQAQALIDKARAKSAQEQKERAEKEELSEFEPVPTITAATMKTAQLETEAPEPKQVSRMLDFSADDTYLKTHGSLKQALMEGSGDDAAWGAAAAAEEDLNEIDARMKFEEKLQQEKKYLAEHPVPQIKPAAKKAEAKKQQALVEKPAPAAPQESQAETWLAHKRARSNQERLEEEMAEVDENYDYDGMSGAARWY